LATEEIERATVSPITLSIADNVTMTRFGLVLSLGRLVFPRQRQQSQALTKSLAVRARDVSNQCPRLSGGNQQKVSFARLLHQDADILLLEEPTRGIGHWQPKAQIYKTIAECADNGKAF